MRNKWTRTSIDYHPCITSEPTKLVVVVVVVVVEVVIVVVVVVVVVAVVKLQLNKVTVKKAGTTLRPNQSKQIYCFLEELEVHLFL